MTVKSEESRLKRKSKCVEVKRRTLECVKEKQDKSEERDGMKVKMEDEMKVNGR